mmetsp:Transcript_7280/g.10654  ORF Transcript_7280/g.10654 Transcript_7280/m.10654 type:complete len:91 (-) Transcript_7280:23-295(-)
MMIQFAKLLLDDNTAKILYLCGRSLYPNLLDQLEVACLLGDRFCMLEYMECWLADILRRLSYLFNEQRSMSFEIRPCCLRTVQSLSFVLR